MVLLLKKMIIYTLKSEVKVFFFWVKSQQRVENSRSLRQVREISAAINKNKNKQTNKQTNKQKEGRNAR